jgi:thiosulfate reductase cytochrome b subunit
MSNAVLQSQFASTAASVLLLPKKLVLPWWSQLESFREWRYGRAWLLRSLLLPAQP